MRPDTISPSDHQDLVSCLHAIPHQSCTSSFYSQSLRHHLGVAETLHRIMYQHRTAVEEEHRDVLFEETSLPVNAVLCQCHVTQNISTPFFASVMSLRTFQRRYLPVSCHSEHFNAVLCQCHVTQNISTPFFASAMSLRTFQRHSLPVSCHSEHFNAVLCQCHVTQNISTPATRTSCR